MEKYRRRVRVRIPATTSNLGPGFDVLGMALKLHNELEISWLPIPGEVRIEIEGEGFANLPRSDKNLVLQAFRLILPKSRFPYALRMRMINRIPLARGLGSSAAARLGGLLAAAALRDFRDSGVADVVAQACALEGHPDNVIAAFHGGLCVSIWDGGQPTWLRLRLPRDLGVVVCLPDFEVSTEKARRLLPAKVPLRDAVHNASRLALLIGALERGELGLLKIAMDDVLHQPYRRPIMRGMDAVIAAAVRAGAFGAALSGAGPSILALTLRGPKQAKIGRAMQKAFFRSGIESRYLALDVEPAGARIEIET
ncbi:MAG: homoserine kinase [Elusimicrobia bacterium]|nr:homoserine kinase [Elusimicrobiota bacterium]